MVKLLSGSWASFWEKNELSIHSIQDKQHEIRSSFGKEC
jgi:hypothetical protein